MKRALLVLGALMAWETVPAQGVFTRLDFGEGRSQFVAYAGSRNGMYVSASESEGSELALFNFKTGQYSYYDEGTPIFNVNGITDDGAVLYSADADGWNSYSRVFKDGKVTSLLWPEKYQYASGDAISADGKYVSGSYVFEKSTQRHPCLWTLTNDVYVFQELPEPALDPLKTVQQAIDLMSMSADGSVLVGRLIDNSGFNYFPIVYTKNNEGKWEYTIKGLDGFFVKEGAEMPNPPKEEPYPELGDFASAADSTAWLTALVSYQDSLENHNLDPDYPAPTYDPTYRLIDFLTPEEYAAYYEAYMRYLNWSNQYWAYMDELDQVMTDKSCSGDFLVSANGRYIASTYQVEGEGGWLGTNQKRTPVKVHNSYNERRRAHQLKTAQGGGMMGNTKSIPFYIDLNTGEFIELTCEEDGLTTSIADDGTLCYCSPYLEYIRNSFIIPAGTNKKISLTDWAKEQKNFDYTDNIKFTFPGYDFDEDGNFIDVMYTDSLISGTASISRDAEVVYSFFWNPEEPIYYNYHVNFNSTSDAAKIFANKHEIACYPNPATNQLNLTAPATAVEFIDLSGAVVYKVMNVAKSIDLSGLDRGTYLVRMHTNRGISTQKLVITK